MKIVIATGIYPPDIGGPATYSKLLFDQLQKRGIEVLVLSFGEVRRLPKIIRHFVYFLKLFNRTQAADVIFAQDTFGVGFPALWVSKIRRIRFFVRVPGDYAWEQATQRFGVVDSVDRFQSRRYGWYIEFLRTIQKMTVSGATVIITPSLYFKRIVSTWIKNKEKVFCIYNGVDYATIPKHDDTYEPKTIMSAGRLILSKGFDTLIETMLLLPGWSLFIAGDGPEKKSLLAKSESLGLSGRVIFLGEMSRNELLKKLKKCEAFVLNTKFESFSFQCVEAMAIGVPVVTCGVGGLVEIVEDQKDGILVKPDDKVNIARAVIKLSADKSFREMVVLAAKKKSQMFSIENSVIELVKLFNKHE